MARAFDDDGTGAHKDRPGVALANSVIRGGLFLVAGITIVFFVWIGVWGLPFMEENRDKTLEKRRIDQGRVMKLSAVEFYENEPGIVHLTGKIENTGDRDCPQVIVAFTLLGNDGTLVGKANAVVKDIPAGETKRFVATSKATGVSEIEPAKIEAW